MTHMNAAYAFHKADGKMVPQIMSAEMMGSHLPVRCKQPDPMQNNVNRQIRWIQHICFNIFTRRRQ